MPLVCECVQSAIVWKGYWCETWWVDGDNAVCMEEWINLIAFWSNDSSPFCEKKNTFSSSPLQPQSWCSSRDFSLTDIQTVQSQKLQQITSGHEQNCRHQVTSDKSSAGQKWTIAQNNVNHNNIYNDLIVSTSNVSPCVPSRGYVDFSTQLWGRWGDCVRCLDERADNSRTPVWQMVRLTLCGSVSNKPCCHC